MSPNGYGAAAVANIFVCLILALYLLLPFAMGGFNVVAVTTYLALLTSVAASFYLLAQRHELSPRELTRAAVFAGVALLVALLPLLFGVGWYFLRG